MSGFTFRFIIWVHWYLKNHVLFHQYINPCAKHVFYWNPSVLKCSWLTRLELTSSLLSNITAGIFFVVLFSIYNIFRILFLWLEIWYAWPPKAYLIFSSIFHLPSSWKSSSFMFFSFFFRIYLFHYQCIKEWLGQNTSGFLKFVVDLKLF